MTLPRLAELTAYWKNCPPTHLTSAKLAGYKPPETSGKGNEEALPDFAMLPDVEEGA